MKPLRMLQQKKGALEDVSKIGIALLTVGMVIAIAFLILSTVLTQIGTTEGITVTNLTQCQTSASCNATTETMSALATLPGWLSIIVIVAIGAMIIGLIAMFRKGR